MNSLKYSSRRFLYSTSLVSRSNFRTFYNKPTPYPQNIIFKSNLIKSPRRLFSGKGGLLGASTISTFHKTAYVMWLMPITALLSPYVNTLPFDAIYGTVIPYHAYVGMHHILTDYLHPYAIIAYIIGAVLFIGLQNLNFNGEGISKTIYRTFSKPSPVKKQPPPPQQQQHHKKS